jgi:hypothetical protein
LPGGHFLVHHVDVTVGAQSVRAIEIMGEPDGEGGYLARFYFTGGREIAPAAQSDDTPTARVRSTLTVASDRASMTARWERSEDGTTWQPWMDIAFARHE